MDDNHIDDPGERETLTATISAMQRLHADGRDHIWAYYTRNLVRPVALSRAKVDVLIGNPPWINYNQTADVLRTELQNMSRDLYGIWAGGRYAAHQDVAGLFFTRSVDLYLNDGGLIGFVMPHSALQSGQYSKWRSGDWKARRGGRALAADFTVKPAWDLERLEPNTFFPVPASVVFAQLVGVNRPARPLAGHAQRWLGMAGADDVRRESSAITDTSVTGDSPYYSYSRLGAILYPRCLIFVNKTENTAIIQAGQTVTVNPRRGSQDKKPWRDIDLTTITGQTIESRHLFDVYLGESIAPYVSLDPLKALLPVKHGDSALPADDNGPGGIRLGGLERRMRERWQTVSRLWNEYKAPVNKLDLLSQFDYWGHLSAQLKKRHQPGDRPIRVVYTKSGEPTATLISDDDSIIDHTLFWIPCKDIDEANYLLAIINSNTLSEAVAPLMPKGQFGARHLQKHLWKLPIPEYDPAIPLHGEIADAGQAAAAGAAQKLEQLRQERGARLTVTIARRELRAWLRASPEGAAVEGAVARLLAGAADC